MYLFVSQSQDVCDKNYADIVSVGSKLQCNILALFSLTSGNAPRLCAA